MSGTSGPSAFESFVQYAEVGDALPVPKCEFCGHEGNDDVDMVHVSDAPGQWSIGLKPVCYGCLDKYEDACREAMAEVKKAD